MQEVMPGAQHNALNSALPPIANRGSATVGTQGYLGRNVPLYVPL
jgi:hypothetical protein